MGDGPAQGRCDSRAARGGARGRELPSGGPCVRAAGRCGVWVASPGRQAGVLAAAILPVCGPRGGRGGERAGSGCAAAVLPPQVGECGSGRVSALPTGRPGLRAPGRREGPGKAQLKSQGRGRPGSLLGAEACGVAIRAAG